MNIPTLNLRKIIRNNVMWMNKEGKEVQFYVKCGMF